MNSLHRTIRQFRMLNINTALKSVSEYQVKPTNVFKLKDDVGVNHKLLFSPRTVGVEIADKPAWQPSLGIKQDPIPYIPIVNPRSILPLLDIKWRNEEIGLPAIEREEKLAVRLLVIRRKKMKKHQRRKLWKKMRHRWAKIWQHRRQVKERKFQSSLLSMIKKANNFDAETYVAEKLELLNHKPLPTRWRGKKLPEFIIRQLLGLDKKINYKHTDVYKA